MGYWYPKFNLLKTYKSSNPWYIIPTIAFRDSVFKLDDGRWAGFGSVAVMFLCFELWLSFKHTKKYPEYQNKMDAWRKNLRKEIESWDKND